MCCTINLRNRRKELGLNLNDVAKIVGVTGATVSRWESGEIGNMRRDRIELLAKALKVSTSDILGTDAKPAEPTKLAKASSTTDLLDFLFHDEPDFLAKIRNIDIKGKINDPAVRLTLTDRQKDRIKDIIRLTVKEAEMNKQTHTDKVTIKKE